MPGSPGQPVMLESLGGAAVHWGNGEPQKKTGETQEEQRVGSSIEYCQWILPEARRGPPEKTTEKLVELTQCWEAELAYESQRESF